MDIMDIDNIDITSLVEMDINLSNYIDLPYFEDDSVLSSLPEHGNESDVLLDNKSSLSTSLSLLEPEQSSSSSSTTTTTTTTSSSSSSSEQNETTTTTTGMMMQLPLKTAEKLIITSNDETITQVKLFNNFIIIIKCCVIKKNQYQGCYHYIIDGQNGRVCNKIESQKISNDVGYVCNDHVALVNITYNKILIYSRSDYKAQFLLRLRLNMFQQQPKIIIKDRLLYCQSRSRKSMLHISIYDLFNSKKLYESKTTAGRVYFLREKFLPAILSAEIRADETILKCFTQNNIVWITDNLMSCKRITENCAIAIKNEDEFYFSYSLVVHQIVYNINMHTGMIKKVIKLLLPVYATSTYFYYIKPKENLYFHCCIADGVFYLFKNFLDQDTNRIEYTDGKYNTSADEIINGIQCKKTYVYVFTSRNIHVFDKNKMKLVYSRSIINDAKNIEFNSKLCCQKYNNNHVCINQLY